MQVWKDLETSLGFQDLWHKETVDMNFQEWFIRRELNPFREVPFLVTWGIWLAHNSSLFEDKPIPYFQISTQVLALLSVYKPNVSIKEWRVVGALSVDRSYAWSFFTWACQGPGKTCSLGFVLFLSDSHFFTAKANLGKGTNNVGEFKALLFLMKSALNKGIVRLHIFGDSSLTINWMQDQLQVHSTGLSPLAKHLKEISRQFQEVSFKHVYRELNVQVDTLSKDGLQLMENQSLKMNIKRGF
jgi:ribonuclease HI